MCEKRSDVKINNLYKHTFVYNALESDHGEESTGNGCCRNGREDDNLQEVSGVPAAFSMEKDISRFASHIRI